MGHALGPPKGVERKTVSLNMASKYHAKKVLSQDGIEFDSKLEAKRWDYLRGLEEEGRIWDLRRQVEYVLIPRQPKLVIKMMKTKMKVEGRLGENPVAYTADFVYKTNYKGPIAFDPTLDTINYYTDRGDMIYFGFVANILGPNLRPALTDFNGEITVVEDTKGFKTPEYVIKRKLMRYMENIAIREIKKPYEEI